jgi:hypothetical protein
VLGKSPRFAIPGCDIKLLSLTRASKNSSTRD